MTVVCLGTLCTRHQIRANTLAKQCQKCTVLQQSTLCKTAYHPFDRTLEQKETNITSPVTRISVIFRVFGPARVDKVSSFCAIYTVVSGWA
jgi:hypothetical protein